MKLEYMLNRSTTPLIPAVKLIFAKEGARGFWKGNFVNLLRTTPYKAINFRRVRRVQRHSGDGVRGRPEGCG
jgi:hypothetical protein